MGGTDEAGAGHYEVLGVSPTASTAEIRSAYVALARTHHPDRASPADASAAASRMARINAAWTVLSDETRRATYDASRFGDDRLHGARVRAADSSFRPFEDDGTDPDPRDFDDTPTGAPTLRRGITLVPAALAVAGLVVAFLGLLLGFVGLLGLGVFVLVVSGLSFLLLPMLALVNSSRADRDP